MVRSRVSALSSSRLALLSGLPIAPKLTVAPRPQSAIDYEADTEFNDALRRHGIIPPKKEAAAGSRSPSPPPRAASPTLSELDLEDLDADKDDSVRRDDIERILEARKEREKEQLGKRKFGRVYNIGKVDYKREVTDASNEELPGEPEGWGTGVVCVLFKDACAPTLHLLPTRSLAD